MSDIDFDELDRAVNGALGGNNTPTPRPSFQNTPDEQTPKEEPPVVSEAPSIERIERTSLTSVTPGLPIQPRTPAQTAPAARRSSGRFMDMVHPSSDMRSHTPTAPIERTPVERAPAPQPVVEEPAIIESPAWNEPLESPFLPDAKVEKRPLGGGDASNNEPVTIVDSFDFQGLLDEPEEGLLEAPEPQPRIEAIASPDPIATPTDESAIDIAINEVESKAYDFEELEKPAETPLAAPFEAPVASEPAKSFAEALRPVVDEPVGPTSITPQYKEQASSNQHSGAMYDTESYHQPVTPPAGKKSGWLTVLWIVLLIVVGAAGGWAVYTYVLPML